ncbi:MAG: MFS transporter [Candidatus Hodarchaeota archaeon]
MEENRSNSGKQALVYQRTRNTIVRVNIISFFGVFSSSIFNLALVNIWIYKFNYAANLIGIIESVYAFSYLIGPILLQKVALKLGAKHSILISVIISIAFMFIQFFYLAPVVLIIINICIGLTDGLFWPNVHSMLSQLKRILRNANIQYDNSIMKRFGISWSSGALLGNLAGFFMVMMSNNDYFALVFGWLVSFIQLSVIFIIRDPQLIKISRMNEKLTSKKKKIKNDDGRFTLFLLIFPVVTIFIGEFTFQVSKSMVNFIFPFFLHGNDIPSSWIYLVIFFQQLSQISAIFLSSKLKQGWKLSSAILAIVAMITCNLLLITQESLFLVIFDVISVGFYGGLVYAFITKILFTYGNRRESLRYSTVNETVSSLGFGLMPLLGGFFIERGFYLNLILLNAILAGSLACFIIIGRVVKHRIKEANELVEIQAKMGK